MRVQQVTTLLLTYPLVFLRVWLMFTGQCALVEARDVHGVYLWSNESLCNGYVPRYLEWSASAPVWSQGGVATSRGGPSYTWTPGR